MSKKKKMLIISGMCGLVLIICAIIAIIIFSKQDVYTISFNTNGGTKIEDQVISEGEKVTKPLDPEKNGYIFKGWTYQGKFYDFNQEVTSDMILIAKWTTELEEMEKFVIKFDSDGGSLVLNQEIEVGSKVVKPEDPKKEGYIFKGWTLNDKEYDIETKVENDLKLVAKWEKVKETNNNLNNGTINNNTSNTIDNNESNNSISNVTDGNNSNNNNQTTSKKYTVTFDTGGGSAINSQTVSSGSKASKPSNPTKYGYTFKNWTLNGNEYNFNNNVNANITLTANWVQGQFNDAIFNLLYKTYSEMADMYTVDNVLPSDEECFDGDDNLCTFVGVFLSLDNGLPFYAYYSFRETSGNGFPEGGLMQLLEDAEPFYIAIPYNQIFINYHDGLCNEDTLSVLGAGEYNTYKDFQFTVPADCGSSLSEISLIPMGIGPDGI